MLEPKNSFLRGVPTNNQLTLTLLRMGEAHSSPIPPIRGTRPSDANICLDVQVDQVPLSASHHEIEEAIEPSQVPNGQSPSSQPANPNKTSQENDAEESGKPKHRHLSRIIDIFKGNTKAVVETKLAVDHVRATAGSHKARGHLGVLPEKKNLIYSGPREFIARFDGKKGWLSITSPSSSSKEERRLIFTTLNPRNQPSTIDISNQNQAEWSIEIRNIHRLKRATAFVSKMIERAVDWNEEAELLGSLEIEDEGGKTWRFTALTERDELFNRLVAVGNQKWVNM